ncbi:bacteriophage regulatory protein [Escherichia coli M056]|nr:bacteriophage regulatory protein [Escherichia coli M056]OSK25159.1 bacteriophage regulatory protein [Escherichia coli M056]
MMATFPCPICGASSRTRTSYLVTESTRQAYFQCNNLLCGTTYAVTLSFSHIVSRGTLSPDIRNHPPVPMENIRPAHKGRAQIDMGF